MMDVVDPGAPVRAGYAVASLRPTRVLKKSVVFWPWTMPANAQ